MTLSEKDVYKRQQKRHRHRMDRHNGSSWRCFQLQFVWDEVRKGYAHNNQ